MSANTKLTAVTIYFRNRCHNFFLQLEYDNRGAARMPQHTLDRLLDQIGVRRGDTYTLG